MKILAFINPPGGYMQIEKKEIVIHLRDDGSPFSIPMVNALDMEQMEIFRCLWDRVAICSQLKSFCTISALRTLPTNSQVMNPDIKTG